MNAEEAKQLVLVYLPAILAVLAALGPAAVQMPRAELERLIQQRARQLGLSDVDAYTAVADARAMFGAVDY